MTLNLRHTTTSHYAVKYDPCASTASPKQRLHVPEDGLRKPPTNPPRN
jgi:hypothetical protein